MKTNTSNQRLVGNCKRNFFRNLSRVVRFCVSVVFFFTAQYRIKHDIYSGTFITMLQSHLSYSCHLLLNLMTFQSHHLDAILKIVHVRAIPFSVNCVLPYSTRFFFWLPTFGFLNSLPFFWVYVLTSS
jgi:hypothetical protein